MQPTPPKTNTSHVIAAAPTYEGGYGRQQRFHEVAQKHRAQHQEPSVAGRHVFSPPLGRRPRSAAELLENAVQLHNDQAARDMLVNS